jgi:hypothetical protein
MSNNSYQLAQKLSDINLELTLLQGKFLALQSKLLEVNQIINEQLFLNNNDLAETELDEMPMPF